MIPEIDKVEVLAAKIRQYYLEKDFFLFSNLCHRVPTRWEVMGMWKEHQRRLNAEYTVSPYTIEQYSQPSWDIFLTHRLVPEPTHVIQMSLKSPKYEGAEELWFACASANGEYRICDYVPRHPDNGSDEFPPEIIDLAPIYDELRKIISTGIQAIGSRLGGRAIGFIRLDYIIENYPTSPVSLYPYYENLNQAGWQEMIHGGGEYSGSQLLPMAYRALLFGAQKLMSVDGAMFDLAQHKFDRQFPDWDGLARFKAEVRKCMLKAFAKSLADAHQRGIFSWKERKIAVVASHEELGEKSAPLRRSALMEGITFFGVFSKKHKAAKAHSPYGLQTVFCRGERKP